MNDILPHIAGATKLTEIFGYWPSFHDAEVHLLTLERPDEEHFPLPTLKLVFEVWELTNEVNSRGHLVSRKRTRVTLKFTDADKIDLTGFNHQNAIFWLRVEFKSPEGHSDEGFIVTLEPVFGLSGQFECRGIEVVDAMPFVPQSAA